MLIRRRRSPRPSRPPSFSWRTLAFEVFVIVLGVTLALGANELRQRYLDRQQVEAATASIAAELQFNCERLTQTQTYHEQVIAELDSLRVAQTVDDTDGMATMQELPTWNGYNPAFITSAAYETAQATGALELMPYEQALGLGRYYTFVELYQETIRQSVGAVLRAGEPTVTQIEATVQITNELQRTLAPQSCQAAAQLGATTTVEEPTESASDSTTGAS